MVEFRSSRSGFGDAAQPFPRPRRHGSIDGLTSDYYVRLFIIVRSTDWY